VADAASKPAKFRAIGTAARRAACPAAAPPKKQCATEPASCCRQLRNEPSGDRPDGLFLFYGKARPGIVLRTAGTILRMVACDSSGRRLPGLCRFKPISRIGGDARGGVLVTTASGDG
jgi:hypothetical protein